MAAARSDQRWSDYQIIIWQDQPPKRLAGLARLGVTAGRISGTRGPLDPTAIPQQVAPFQATNLRFYIENIATDFYAAYHRWHPDRPVTWLFDEARRRHREHPQSIAAFIRTPSLSDPAWLHRVALRLQNHAQAYKRYRPLYFNLADEPGIGDLAAAWDFDFHPASLAAMRLWLRRQYGSLAALNRQWGTDFPAWGAVLPMTTDAALNQRDQNFSAWADFKAWMDVAFARAIKRGTAALHAADPHAFSGLEGAQPPGWGGYDYTRLPEALDVMEIYDHGNNVEIARALKPGLVTLTTSSLVGPQEVNAVWRELLLGGRGLILWDPDNTLVDDDGAPTARGRMLRELASDLRSGLAAQLIASNPASDPVAILYSPASLRTQWLLDRIADGRPWAERRAEDEYSEGNPVRTAMRRATAMLTHLGVQPRWMTPEMIEKGRLQRGGVRLLVLPHTIALSPAAAAQIRNFVRRGGTVLADAVPAQSDAHSRRLPRPLLADPAAAGGPIRLMPELQDDRTTDDPEPLARFRQIVQQTGVVPRVTLSASDGGLVSDVDVRIFANGGVRIIGLQRDWSAENRDHRDVVMRLTGPAYVYDLRHPGPAKHGDTIKLTLDPVAPELLAISPRPLPKLELTASAQARLGAGARFRIFARGQAVADERIVRVAAIPPDAAGAAKYTANLRVHRGHAIAWAVPLAPEDPIGRWTIRVTDVLAGRTTDYGVDVVGVSPPPRAR